MAAKILFGWGGVMFVYGNLTATFPTSFGVLGFEKDEIVNKTITGEEIPHFKGERAIIDTELFNCSDTAYIQWQALAAIISNSRNDEQPITVYPRYDAADEGSQAYYLCRCDSNFNPDDIGSKGNMQTIKLQFRERTLQRYLPINVSDYADGGWTDENLQQYVDEAAAQYKLR